MFGVLVGVFGVLVGFHLYWDGVLGIFGIRVGEIEHLVSWMMYLVCSLPNHEDLVLHSLIRKNGLLIYCFIRQRRGVSWPIQNFPCQEKTRASILKLEGGRRLRNFACDIFKKSAFYLRCLVFVHSTRARITNEANKASSPLDKTVCSHTFQCLRCPNA